MDGFSRGGYFSSLSTRWQDCAIFENSMNAGKSCLVLARQNCIEISLKILIIMILSEK